mmetsp:Transcript_56079/g.176001  ORF Transcript_56079/g.176001 Transcript_56079/m.176001 type:complete len:247 (-) Transcript_56079:86-826(-)
MSTAAVADGRRTSTGPHAAGGVGWPDAPNQEYVGREEQQAGAQDPVKLGGCPLAGPGGQHQEQLQGRAAGEAHAGRGLEVAQRLHPLVTSLGHLRQDGREVPKEALVVHGGSHGADEEHGHGVEGYANEQEKGSGHANRTVPPQDQRLGPVVRSPAQRYGHGESRHPAGRLQGANEGVGATQYQEIRVEERAQDDRGHRLVEVLGHDRQPHPLRPAPQEATVPAAIGGCILRRVLWLSGLPLVLHG